MSLTEPEVLATTKKYLFPEENEYNYVVVDSQFTRETWLTDEAVNEEILDQLSPFNHIKIGNGYPDMVGVAQPPSNCILDDFSLQSNRPLISVEAKGYTRAGDIDLKSGIFQAYDRLLNSNLSFLAAPLDSFDETTISMSENLNIGLLGIDPKGEIEIVKKSKLLGFESSKETQIIRYQASPQGIRHESFPLNHPKNYLAYPLALYHEKETEVLIKKYIVNIPRYCSYGAEFLGLINREPKEELTQLGEEVVRFALRNFDSIEEALRSLEKLKGSRKRFVKASPDWVEIIRYTMMNYPFTKILVREINKLQKNCQNPTIIDLVKSLYKEHSSLSIELFIKEKKREEIFDEKDNLKFEKLKDPKIYQTHTTFQFKTMLYHAGIIENRGYDINKFNPEEDIWKLRQLI